MVAAVDLQQRSRALRDDIAAVASGCGRRVDDITVVAITKTHGLDVARSAVAAGFTDIGESRVQETEKKFATERLDCRLHLVGHLQSNKAKKAVGLFDMIQSVDSLRLAGRIDAEAGKANRRLPILMEVNTSGERQKFGLAPEEVVIAADKIAMMDHLALCGLMTVGPLTDDEGRIRRSFGELRKLFETVKSSHPELTDFSTLSMGMSDDYRLAIEEGTTMLRIGRALFGPRAV
jgi:hypothetical protein